MIPWGATQEAILGGGSAEHWQASSQQSWLDSGLKNHTLHVNLYKFHLFNSRCSLDSCLLETIVKAMDSFDVSCLVSVFISKCCQSLEVESRSVVWAGLELSAVPECCYYNHEPQHPAWILLHCSQLLGSPYPVVPYKCRDHGKAEKPKIFTQAAERGLHVHL